MKKYLAAGVLFFTFAAYGAAVIFQGPYVKTLKDDLKLGDTARIITGTADPQSSATEGEPGSIYIRNNGGVGTVLFKTDTGSSTNWSLLPDAATLTEVDGNVNDLITLSGEAENSTAHGAFTGTVLSGVTTTRSGLQALGTQVDTNTSAISTNAGNISTNTTNISNNDTDIADLVTLSGVAANSASLGTFTGTLLADSLTVKDAIQDVEDYLEATMYRETTGDNLIIFGETPGSFDASQAFYNIVLDPQGASSTLSTGDNNILIGRNAGAGLTTTGQNIMIGDQAGASTLGASSSIIIGHQAGNLATDSDLNVIIGWQAGRRNLGDYSVMLGYEAGEYQQTGGAFFTDYNVFIGYQAGKEAEGSSNIMLGSQVGLYGGVSQSVSDLLLIDNNDCDYSITGTRCLIEGSMSGTNDRLDIGGELYVADNNDLRLAETDANGTDYIGFKAPASVTTATTFTLPDGDGSNGQLLKTDGSATLSWADPIAANGSINLETDPYFQQGQGTWTTYDDGASATPVDFTGGSPSGLTITASATDTSILADPYDGNLKMAKAAADHQGEGIAKAFTIPNAVQDRGQFYVSGWYTTSTGLSTGDVVFQCYDVTNAALLTQYGLTDNELAGLAANVVGKFNVRVPIASTTASVRCGFHWATASTSALDISFSGLKIGPDSLVDAPIITYLGDLTTTGAWTTNTTYTGKYWRRDDMLIGDVFASLSGAPDNTAFDFDLPSGYTIDTSKLGGSTSIRQDIGTCYFRSAGTDYQATARYSTTTTFIPIFSTASGTFATGDSIGGNTDPGTWASGDSIHCRYQVPIVEFSGQSGTLSTTEAMNENVFVSAYLNSAQNHDSGSATWDLVALDTELADSHNAFDTTTSLFTAPESGTYVVSGSVRFTSISSNNLTGVRIYKNGATEVAINISNSGGATDPSGRTVTKTLELAKGDTLGLWGYQDDSSSEAFTNAEGHTFMTIVKVPDLSVYGVYGQYEIKSFTGTAFALSTSGYATGEWAQMSNNSMTLPPGTWRLSGAFYYDDNTATTTLVECRWTAANGDNTTSTPTALNTVASFEGFSEVRARAPMTTDFSTDAVYQMPNNIITVTSETTVYGACLVDFSSASTGDLQVVGQAERLR